MELEIIINAQVLKLQNPYKKWRMMFENYQTKQNIFLPILQRQVCYPDKQQSLVDGELTFILGSNEVMLASLTPEHIILKNAQGQLFYTSLNFQTKFQVILQKQGSIKSKKLGFRIIKQNNFQTSGQLYFIDPQNGNKWVKALSKYINRHGFHENFKAIRRLGKGQFATVFEVEELQSGQKFAVKAFSKSHLLKTPKGFESLINQIKIMRSFCHKNLLKLHSVFESENSIYLVTELFKGGSLFQRIQKLVYHDKIGLNSQNIRQFMLGMFHGLSRLQQIGIAHRDLKLDNIMLRNASNFQPVIIDFGLATFVDEDQYIYYRCGTPGYVSPEVMVSSKSHKIGTQSDIFSLGAVFYHLLNQKPLFEGKKPQEILAKNKSFSFDFQNMIIKIKQTQAGNLLQKMLQVNPSKRIKCNQGLFHQYFDCTLKQASPSTSIYCESQKQINQVISF